jgi:hypothetical protein
MGVGSRAPDLNIVPTVLQAGSHIDKNFLRPANDVFGEYGSD